MTQLIFLPGLACDATLWAAQLPVTPVALRPAVTDVHTRFATLSAMAEALLQEHPGELILCGASMGGMLALEVVRQAPTRVRGLALLGTSARPETEDMRALREQAITLFETGRLLEVLQPNLAMAFHPDRATDTALLESYLDFVTRAGAGQLIAQNRAVMARPDARRHLQDITCPTLVLCGDSDLLTPPDCSREIAAQIPAARLHLIPRCGHMLTMEQPEVVNALLGQWLAELGHGRP
jgi:pimeloyl-ACP methyl ester carboxylesterase